MIDLASFFRLKNMDMKEDYLQHSDNGELIAIANSYMDTRSNLSSNSVRMNWMKKIGSLISVGSKN